MTPGGVEVMAVAAELCVQGLIQCLWARHAAKTGCSQPVGQHNMSAIAEENRQFRRPTGHF